MKLSIICKFIACYSFFPSFINFLPARHILCEKQGKINEAYKKLQDGWLSNGDKVPPAEFAKVSIVHRSCFQLVGIFN